MPLLGCLVALSMISPGISRGHIDAGKGQTYVDCVRLTFLFDLVNVKVYTNTSSIFRCTLPNTAKHPQSSASMTKPSYALRRWVLEGFTILNGYRKFGGPESIFYDVDAFVAVLTTIIEHATARCEKREEIAYC